MLNTAQGNKIWTVKYHSTPPAAPTVLKLSHDELIIPTVPSEMRKYQEANTTDSNISNDLCDNKMWNYLVEAP